MLLIRLLRYIQGYIEFKADHGFPERFINLCTRNSLPLWNMKNIGGCLHASTTYRAFDSVRSTAEKSGMELTVIKEVSFKRTLEKHKSRKGLLIALFCCICLTVFLSQFVWSISVEGNETYSNEEILLVFEKNGVKLGSLKKNIDTRLSSENAISVLERLSWAKVNIRGCFAVIEVRESIKKPRILDESVPVNIVAKTDGEIIKYEVSRGESILKPGIAVTKGDLLVSGVLTNKDGSERLVHSFAKITAKTTHITNSNAPEKLFLQSDETVKYALFFFGLKIPSYKNDNPDFESREYLDNNEKILPAGVFRYRQAEYGDEYEIDESERILLNAFDSNLKAIDIYKNCEKIISNKTVLSEGIFKCKYICEEQIGVEQEIYTG